MTTTQARDDARQELARQARVLIVGLIEAGVTPAADMVARTLGTSVRTLQRALREFGQEPNLRQTIEAVRLETAAASLHASTKRPIEFIARRVGYRHTTHFCAAFRRRFGVTPQAYRSQQLAQDREDRVQPDYLRRAFEAVAADVEPRRRREAERERLVTAYLATRSAMASGQRSDAGAAGNAESR